MTIQRRLLAGHLAVAALVILPALGAMAWLGHIAERTQVRLRAGMATLSHVDQFRSEFAVRVEKILQFQGLAIPLRDPEYLQSAQLALANLRKDFQAVRPHVRELGRTKEAAFLDEILARPLPPLPPLPEPVSEGQAVEPLPAPEVPWSDAEMAYAREALDLIYRDAARLMILETEAAEASAHTTLLIALGALGVAVVLALISTLLTVRSLRGPLKRLSSATMAVSAGKYGIAVPVGGGDDELSRLTEAFNKMSTNLALFDRMKADFLAIAAHELRTPLTCIKGYVAAIRASLPDHADAEESADLTRFLNRIDREADLIARQVSELLTLGIIEAGQLRLEKREIPTEGFLVMAGEAFKPIAAERRIEFHSEMSRLPATFSGDIDRLNQVLMNLLDNAFKYTSPGGRVVLSARGGSDGLVIEVADTCPGIPADQLQVIFEKYARARTGAPGGPKGTGLGLAVAKGIIVAHGGTMGAASEMGKGCRFSVCLPTGSGLAQPAAAEVA